jgi:hypothetical protein
MSGQSDVLQQLISHFKLKNDNPAYQPPANQYLRKPPNAWNKTGIVLPGGNNSGKYK